MSVPRFITLGSVNLNLFGLTIALGCLAGIYIARLGTKGKDADREKILDLSLYLIIAGILGARLLYVLLDWRNYVANPLETMLLWRGGLSFHGGVIGGLLIGYWYTRKEGLSFGAVADIFAPALAFGYAIARLGCDIYGNPTNQWWGVNVYGVNRHPVQLYSAAAGLIIFLILWQRKDQVAYVGQQLVYYLALYSASRFGIEFFRDGLVVGGIMTLAQLVSLLILIAAILVNHCLRQEGRKQQLA